MRRNKCLSWLLALIIQPLFAAGCNNNDDNDLPTPESFINETVIYEANPGLYGTESAFNAIVNQLDQIKALGVNTLWLMPIYEQGVLNAQGSPYCIKNYKAIDSQYGTLSELKALVSAAHGKGMRVILDWVANHTSWDNDWITNKSWYTQDANGNIISPEGFNWNDVADLNYGNVDMRQAMLDAMKYWITEVDIDGYRCDYAEGVPHDFWQNAIKELKSLKGNDLLMLAEGEVSALFTDGFDMVYGWKFADQLQQVYAGKATVSKLYEVHKAEYAGVSAGKQRMRYITNHDLSNDNSPIQVYGGERGAISAYVIAATLAGSPMIYSSQEIGYASPVPFFNQQSMDWSSNPTYRNEYEQIMAIRKSSSALKTGQLKTYETGIIASFYRSDSKEGILVMVNTTNKEQTVKAPIEQAYNNATDLMNNTTLTIPSVLTFEPYQYMIWKIQK